MSLEAVMWAAGAVATVLTGWQGMQSRQLKLLRDRVKEQDARIATLATWQTTAREYIGQLLFVMAVHGVKPPTPPESLGLAVEDAQPTTPDEEDA